MNIFALHQTPSIAASYLDDRRQNKLLLEAAQIVAAGRYHLGKKSAYGPGYKHHPVCKWAGDERNLDWTARYFFAMGREFTHRTGNVHASSIRMREDSLDSLSTSIMLPESIEFENCAANQKYGLDFKWMKNTVKAYRRYLNERWRIEIEGGYRPVFTNRTVPTWATPYVKDWVIHQEITTMSRTVELLLAPGQFKVIHGVKVENTGQKMKRVKLIIPPDNPG
jgi:hypothetical protein